MNEWTGRCQCGECSFAIEGPPNWVAHCHCESCRAATAAAFATYVAVPYDAWRWTGTEPYSWSSSPGTQWLRCPDCGSLVAYDSDREPDEIHFLMALVDDPEGLVPEKHDSWEERVHWIGIEDDLPKRPGDR